MTPDFDLIVIGSGSAARAVVYPCREAGWRVAVVDSRPLGGTCALRGCDPKKVLVGAAELVDWARAMRGRGVAGELRIDWRELMAFKRTFTDPFPEKMRQSLDKAGIAVLAGRAAFTGPDTIQIGERRLTARHVVIAAGARPVPLGIPGEELAVTSDDFLESADLPRRIVFIGGGYIAFEFAHIAARSGAAVTILHRGNRPLEGFDPDLVDQLCRHTRDLGIDVQVDTKVTALERAAGDLIVRAAGQGADRRFAGDLVVHAAGRTPDLGDLDLERAGVAHDRRGVTVHDHLQSVSNPQVWAAGDAAATSAPRLTPVSGAQGAVVAHNLLTGERQKFLSGPVPTVVYTIPPLAAVGHTEASARQAGLPVETKTFDTSQWYTSRRVGEPCSGAKILVNSETGQVAGAHLLGHGAEETINIFGLAIRCGIAASDLKNAMFSYPTKTSDIEYLV